MRSASKIIFSGLEGSGKSLRMAEYVVRALKANIKYYKITGYARPIYTNMLFSKEFVAVAEKHGIPIKEWKNLDELVGLSGCDIFIDEIGTYFDSRLWADLTLDVRRWVAQCDKNGVNLYGTAQDFAQVDKAFRRLVKKLYHVTKIVGSPRPHFSYPPVKYPFGLFMVRDIDPRTYKEDEPKMDKTGLPSFFFLHKEYYGIFDTTQRIERSRPLPYRHVLRVCELHGNGCNHSKIEHK